MGRRKATFSTFQVQLFIPLRSLTLPFWIEAEHIKHTGMINI